MKNTLIAVILAAILVVGALLLSRSGSSGETVAANNVRVEDGIQVVEITARGGYQPRQSLAKAGLPTILRFKTDGIFDCSAFVRIPSLGISQALNQSGLTDIDLGAQPAGTLYGTCAMGMYPFEIKFGV